jgi:hypothetical protein
MQKFQPNFGQNFTQSSIIFICPTSRSSVQLLPCTFHSSPHTPPSPSLSLTFFLSYQDELCSHAQKCILCSPPSWGVFQSPSTGRWPLFPSPGATTHGLPKRTHGGASPNNPPPQPLMTRVGERSKALDTTGPTRAHRSRSSTTAPRHTLAMRRTPPPGLEVEVTAAGGSLLQPTLPAVDDSHVCHVCHSAH